MSITDQRRTLIKLAAMLLVSPLAASSHAQTPLPAAAPLIPVETLFRKPVLAGAQLSPDQSHLAAVTSTNGRRNLVVVDLTNNKAQAATSLEVSDVLTFSWANNQRLLFTTGDQQGFESRGDGGLFAVDRDGKNGRALISPLASNARVPRLTTMLGRIKGSSDEVLVAANDRSADTLDLYRMNIQNGRKELVSVTTPGKVVRWLVDSQSKPVAALSMDLAKKRIWFSYLAPDSQNWKTGAEWSETLEKVIIPKAVDPAQADSLYVLSNEGKDKVGLHKFDLKTGQLGPLLYADQHHDIEAAFTLGGPSMGSSSRLIFGGNEQEPGKLLGIEYTTDRPVIAWFDRSAAQAQATIDAALPNTVNRFNVTAKRSLVVASSSTNPGEYYMFDREKGALEELGLKPQPWIDPSQMAETQSVSWVARDGLRIEGYLTLPKSFSKGHPVPLIVHPHGGPWARDVPRFNAEVQFMANRGYAVLQPNFRGSLGYGRKHFTASFGQWGGTMIDDMIDGTEWAIKAGYADPDRIAAYGASYGGYATLALMVKRPDLFKWGVNYVGVTDMAVHQDTQPAQKYGDFGEMAKILNGDQTKDREAFHIQSPARHVDKIKGPVFHAYGGRDMNVDFENGRVIKSAFDKANKPYEWMFVADEAHGYRLDKNVFEFYKRFDAFMRAHTPPPKP